MHCQADDWFSVGCGRTWSMCSAPPLERSSPSSLRSFKTDMAAINSTKYLDKIWWFEEVLKGMSWQPALWSLIKSTRSCCGQKLKYRYYGSIIWRMSWIKCRILLSHLLDLNNPGASGLSGASSSPHICRLKLGYSTNTNRPVSPQYLDAKFSTWLDSDHRMSISPDITIAYTGLKPRTETVRWQWVLTLLLIWKPSMADRKSVV